MRWILQRATGSLSLRSGLKTLIDTAQSAHFHDGQIVVSMSNGEEIRFPVADNPRLAVGTPEQLNPIEISPFGLHWPELDEDLSLRGIAAGNYGQRRIKSCP